ncbi:MAG: hypothetical protein R2939_06695 [Kofleriaceae bacterium]
MTSPSVAAAPLEPDGTPCWKRSAAFVPGGAAYLVAFHPPLKADFVPVAAGRPGGA